MPGGSSPSTSGGPAGRAPSTSGEPPGPAPSAAAGVVIARGLGEDPVARGLGEDPVARGGRQVRRAAFAAFLTVAVLFVVSSAWQLTHAIFFDEASGADALAAPPLPPGCAQGIARLAGALDRASREVVAASEQAIRPSDATATFRRSLSPDWDGADTVSRTCGQTSQGEDAWATLARLRTAEEQLARQSRAELAPLRHDVSAHLPAELR